MLTATDIPPDLTTVILTSAVVSGLITAVFGFVGQWIERGARRKELIFTKSIELAKANRDYMLQLGKDMGGGVTIHDLGRKADCLRTSGPRSISGSPC